ARQAIATYRLPDPRLDWEAITFADGRLFLLGGDDFEEEGFIVELLPEGQAAPPAPSAPQPFDPFGVWELAEGSILADEGGRAPKIIEIRDDGSAQLVYLNEDTGHI